MAYDRVLTIRVVYAADEDSANPMSASVLPVGQLGQAQQQQTAAYLELING